MRRIVIGLQRGASLPLPIISINASRDIFRNDSIRFDSKRHEPNRIEVSSSSCAARRPNHVHFPDVGLVEGSLDILAARALPLAASVRCSPHRAWRLLTGTVVRCPFLFCHHCHCCCCFCCCWQGSSLSPWSVAEP